jgi:hypothetical protein
VKSEIGYYCPMKNLILALVLIVSLSGCDVFSSKEKELKQKEEELAQRERELRKRENEPAEPAEKERARPKLDEKTTAKEDKAAEQAYLFHSTDMGYNEYIKRVGDRYFYSTDKVNYVRMGRSMDRGGKEYFYFQNKPNVHYHIWGRCCGFIVENPDGKTQDYDQITPHCE